MGRLRRGYKIVRVDTRTGSMWSAYDELQAVQYKEGVISVPMQGCGPLCVFPTLKDARSYYIERQSVYGDHEIHTCSYKPSWRRSVWNHVDKCRLSRLRLSYRGTCLASSVVLGEKINLKEELI